MVLEAASPRSGGQQLWCLACRWQPLLAMSLHFRHSALMSFPFLIRAQIPVWGPTLMTSSNPSYLLKASSPNTIVMEIIILGGGEHNSVHSRHY